MGANRPIQHPSPNFGPRRNGLQPELVVLHFTEMTFDGALDRLCDPAAEVSAHYLISEAGEVYQLVPEDQRAWHGGAGAWAGADDVNSRSIGIELSNSGKTPFAAPLMDALEGLLPGILDRWSIRPEGVIAHSDMAPERKVDPGARFDWRRLAREGRAIWPSATTATGDTAHFLTDLHRFGYPADAPAEALLRAFRLRFRPWAYGPLDDTDAALAADLAKRFPVDR